MQATSKPWYRHPWPWFLILLPMTAVVASMITIWLAVTSADGLVADDYYKEGMAINKTLKRDQAALAMGLKAELQLDGEVIRIKLEGNQTTLPDSLRLRLVHPTQSGRDQALSLQKSGPNDYVLVIKGLPVETVLPGQRWQVILEAPESDWRLTGTWPANLQPIRLGVSEKVE